MPSIDTDGDGDPDAYPFILTGKATRIVTNENFDFPRPDGVTGHRWRWKIQKHVACDLNSPNADQPFDDKPHSAPDGVCLSDENLMVDQTNSLGAPTGKYAERHGLLQSATKYIQARWTEQKRSLIILIRLSPSIRYRSEAQLPEFAPIGWGRPQRQYRWTWL